MYERRPTTRFRNVPHLGSLRDIPGRNIKCESDAEWLYVYNGFLLAAHLDAAFDSGLISFTDVGTILFSSQFAQEDRDLLGIYDQLALRRGGGHLPNLAWHRTHLLDVSA